jgi:L-fucose isomerase-like protein
MHPALGLTVVSSPLEVGAEQASALLKQAREVLSQIGVRPVAPAVVSDASAARKAGASFGDVDALCVIAATWFEDYLVQDVLAAMGDSAPVIAWGLPGLHTGSLCGTQQLCCVLKELGYTYRFVYGELEDEATQARVLAVSQAAAARRTLRRTRVGRIGSRLPGMTEVAVDEVALRAVLGPRLIERPLDWLTSRAEAADGKEAEEIWARASGNAGSVGVPDSAGLLASRYYLALREFLRAEEISAFTVECYPQLMGQVCLPIALLAEEDVVGACEGDVNSAVGMRLLSWFSGGPVHNTDLLADDPKENTIIFSHCGSGAFCLASSQDEVVLDSCRLMDTGVTVQYPGRPGRVTGVNLVGPSGDYRLGLFGGDAVPTELVFPGNPLKVRLDVPVPDFLEEVAEAGLGHHWMIGEGDAIPAFLEFGRLTGIPVFQPGLRGT